MKYKLRRFVQWLLKIESPTLGRRLKFKDVIGRTPEFDIICPIGLVYISPDKKTPRYGEWENLGRQQDGMYKFKRVK